LKVGWIRRIQVLDTAYWGFLGVGTTFDIFQNIILITYLEYGVLSLSGYGVLIFIPEWSLVELFHEHSLESDEWIEDFSLSNSMTGSPKDFTFKACLLEDVEENTFVKHNTKHPSSFFLSPYCCCDENTSPKHQLPSPSAPNAPSKTPSTKDTSSSSIDYIPKSPTSSTSPSTNGYLNSPTSPPPRVPPLPPIQGSRSMDITLTLSPLLYLMFNLILPHPLHLSLVIPFLGTFLKLMEIHACVAFDKRRIPHL
ncbi:hypothetical protein Tco_0620290, partial [Tanacetum coccineum]